MSLTRRRIVAFPLAVAALHANLGGAEEGKRVDPGDGLAPAKKPTPVAFTPLARFGSAGSGDGNLSYPYGLTVAPDGTLYLADSGNNRIKHVAADGSFISAFGSGGEGNGQFASPRGVAVAANGHVYVADGLNSRVQHFDEHGTFVEAWGSASDGKGNRFGIDVWGDRTYVTYMDGTVSIFVTPPNPRRTFGSDGSKKGQFYSPFGIAAGPSAVYVADAGNHRIQRFSANGKFLGTFGSQGSGTGEFWYPNGVAVAPDGKRVFVADTNNHRVQCFTPNGTFLGSFGSNGDGESEFNYLQGIAVSLDGAKLYVADTYNHRVQILGVS